MASNENPWGGSDQKFSKRVSEKFGQTKDVASTGVEKTKEAAAVSYEKTKVAAKKFKESASTGVNWIKLKCNKSSLFQKK